MDPGAERNELQKAVTDNPGNEHPEQLVKGATDILPSLSTLEERNDMSTDDQISLNVPTTISVPLFGAAPGNLPQGSDKGTIPLSANSHGYDVLPETSPDAAWAHGDDVHTDTMTGTGQHGPADRMASNKPQRHHQNGQYCEICRRGVIDVGASQQDETYDKRETVPDVELQDTEFQTTSAVPNQPQQSSRFREKERSECFEHCLKLLMFMWSLVSDRAKPEKTIREIQSRLKCYYRGRRTITVEKEQINLFVGHQDIGFGVLTTVLLAKLEELRIDEASSQGHCQAHSTADRAYRHGISLRPSEDDEGHFSTEVLKSRNVSNVKQDFRIFVLILFARFQRDEANQDIPLEVSGRTTKACIETVMMETLLYHDIMWQGNSPWRDRTTRLEMKHLKDSPMHRGNPDDLAVLKVYEEYGQDALSWSIVLRPGLSQHGLTRAFTKAEAPNAEAAEEVIAPTAPAQLDDKINFRQEARGGPSYSPPATLNPVMLELKAEVIFLNSMFDEHKQVLETTQEPSVVSRSVHDLASRCAEILLALRKLQQRYASNYKLLEEDGGAYAVILRLVNITLYAGVRRHLDGLGGSTPMVSSTVSRICRELWYHLMYCTPCFQQNTRDFSAEMLVVRLKEAKMIWEACALQDVVEEDLIEDVNEADSASDNMAKVSEDIQE